MYKLLAFVLILFVINVSFSKGKDVEPVGSDVSGEDSLQRRIDSICNLRIKYFISQFGSVTELEKYYGKPVDSILADCRAVWLDSLVISPEKK